MWIRQLSDWNEWITTQNQTNCFNNNNNNIIVQNKIF